MPDIAKIRKAFERLCAGEDDTGCSGGLTVINKCDLEILGGELFAEPQETDNLRTVATEALKFYENFIGYLNADDYDIPDSSALRDALVAAGFTPNEPNGEDDDAEEIVVDEDDSVFEEFGDCERCGKPATTWTLADEELCSECGAEVEAAELKD